MKTKFPLISSTCLGIYFILLCSTAQAQTKTVKDDLRLADMYYARQKYDEARTLYLQHATSLSADQQAKMGAACFGTSQKNHERVSEGITWLKKGAAGGSTEAMNSLSFCYGNGIGVDKDPEQEMQWLTKSADKGDDKALVALGYKYQTGKGVTQDDKKAQELYQNAANKGNAQAAYFVSAADNFRNPTLTTWHWLKKSAQGDYLPAMLKLGELYEKEGDPDEAVRWYTKILATKGFTAEHRAAAQKQREIGSVEPSTDIKTVKPLLMKLISAAANDYSGTLSWEKEPLKGSRVDILSTNTYYTTTLDIGFKNALVRKEVVEARDLGTMQIRAGTYWSYSADIVYSVSEETALRVFEKWVTVLTAIIPQWKSYRERENTSRPSFTIGGKMTNGKEVMISIGVSGAYSDNVWFTVSNRD